MFKISDSKVQPFFYTEKGYSMFKIVFLPHKLCTMVQVPFEMQEKATDPMVVLPTEIVGMVLQYFSCLRGVVALERVSKNWASVISRVCTPAWAVSCWGVDVDWSGNILATRGNANVFTGWQRFKAEVKSCNDMLLGFPHSAFVSKSPGFSKWAIRDDYIARLHGPNHFHRTDLSIWKKESVLTEQGLPAMHIQCGAELSITHDSLLKLCGIADDPYRWEFDYCGTGPDAVLMLLRRHNLQRQM
ncbi:hypothetical protein BJ508DRAFT_167618 [Ascobolus immersus RN42]|uniref:F-box domain-containing protein n=1 Tax=Ascobolus immersus RN42 TaxID=1160509 RepID=A0A3N4IJG8_ASCIM|nr:hypothetical protein BJ508DRAFT_167618 [Ascobolus immersus RN42]